MQLDAGADAMISMDASEAQRHPFGLLKPVAAGGVVTITKDGQPITRLVKAEGLDREIDALKALRSGAKLEDLDWKALRDEGRR
jgi:prevent-host-death family protein